MTTSRLTPLVLAASLAAALSLGASAAEAAKAPSKPKPAAHAAKPAVPFLEDAYTKALAEARARQVPIFIEAWAPW